MPQKQVYLANLFMHIINSKLNANLKTTVIGTTEITPPPPKFFLSFFAQTLNMQVFYGSHLSPFVQLNVSFFLRFVLCCCTQYDLSRLRPLQFTSFSFVHSSAKFVFFFYSLLASSFHLLLC